MYNDYFGFRESPFNVTPDPRFLYTNPDYQEAFAALRYGIEGKTGFIVITGEVGTGKTTLLRKLMISLGDTTHSVFIFNTLLTFPDLLQLILNDLGLVPNELNRVTMLGSLNDYLIKQLKHGHVVALLIDEAQNLSDETLEGVRLLSNLETGQEKLLQIVLMGQPELKAKLDQPGLRQLKQRVAVQCQLAPLKEEEVGAYIDYRLRTVGFGGKNVFPPDAVKQIAFYSQGIPRLINILCDNALLSTYAESKKIVAAQTVEEVGRDLRLFPPPSSIDAKTAALLPPSRGGAERPYRHTLGQVRSHKSRHLVRVGLRTVLVLLIFLSLAAIIDPQEFYGIAIQRLEVSKRNLNQWVHLFAQPQPLPEAAQERITVKEELPIASEPKLQRVSIQRGSTISKIVRDAYGANNLLGLDLVKESNPQIADLNWVFPGQDLLLPELTYETMMRKQPDGSYRIIVASFTSATQASEYSRLLGRAGYKIAITPKRVADDLLLHRLEIHGLRNSEEANQSWETGIKNQWFQFAGDSRNRD